MTQHEVPQYVLPPEWVKQSGVLMAWPHGHSDWSARLNYIEPAYVALARAISAHEPLVIACWDQQHTAHVLDLLRTGGATLSNIHCVQVPTNDTWLRDTAPLTVFDQKQQAVLLDFTFNGWGNKYDARLDNALTERLHQLGAFGQHERRAIDLVLEGGSIEVNGRGSLLTTAACLLAKTRNPTLSQQQIENQLHRFLGVDQVLWLQHGYLAGDDTDSHVDMLARFCDEKTICYVGCDDARDEHYDELQAMAAELRAFRTRDGEPFRLIELPWPRAKYNEEDERLPASYANFLIINDAVLVPVYDDPADAIALERIGSAFPQRDIVAVPGLPLIEQRGGLHCATMQFPTGVLSQDIA